MAITINIYYKGKNDNARRFAKEMIESGTVDKIRLKEGNLRYEYFFPIDDDETVLLIDSWKSQEAIDEHHASSMMNIISDLRNKYDLHMHVERYVSDDENQNIDQKYIRK
ncbi:putative quinol monooxygenase [Terrisporobacter sp.]